MPASRPPDRRTANPSADDNWNDQAVQRGGLRVVAKRLNNNRWRAVVARTVDPTATAAVAATALSPMMPVVA